MLWLRFWLETRPRLLFAVVWTAVFLGVGLFPAVSQTDVNEANVVRGFLTQSAFIAVLTAGMLAGSGVRTQMGPGRGGMTRGLHASTHFTLSLPVSRARLVLARALVGVTELWAVLVVLSVTPWLILEPLRANISAADLLQHVAAAWTCGFAIHGLAVLTSTVLDDVTQMWAIMLASFVLGVPWIARYLPEPLRLIRALTEASPVVTDTMPWAVMAVAVVLGGVFVAAATKVVRLQEY